PATPPMGWPTGRDTQGSVGRAQPYAAHPLWLRNQQPTDTAGTPIPDTTAAPQIRHTFFRHNSKRPLDSMNNPPTISTPATDSDTAAASTDTLRMPFDWLLHLDRTPQNPIELLHVSGFKPHELTQQFMAIKSDVSQEWRFAHEARWTDTAAGSPVHRLLELI